MNEGNYALVWLSSSFERNKSRGTPYRRIEWGVLDQEGQVVERVTTNEGADFEVIQIRGRWGRLSRLAGLHMRVRPEHGGIDKVMSRRVVLAELHLDRSGHLDVRKFIEWDKAEPELMIAAEAFRDAEKRRRSEWENVNQK